MLDPRLTPARPDLADIRLRGSVEAGRYVAGETRRVIAAAAPLRRSPDLQAGLDTEAVMGDPVTLYEARDGFAFVQLQRDGGSNRLGGTRSCHADVEGRDEACHRPVHCSTAHAQNKIGRTQPDPNQCDFSQDNKSTIIGFTLSQLQVY